MTHMHGGLAVWWRRSLSMMMPSVVAALLQRVHRRHFGRHAMGTIEARECRADRRKGQGDCDKASHKCASERHGVPRRGASSR